MKDLKHKILLLFILFPVFSFAQLEVYEKFNRDGSCESIIDYGGTKRISKKLSVTFFGLVRKEWAQALVGLSYTYNKSLIVSSSIGIETRKSTPRYSSSIWLKQNKTTLLVLGELGSGKDNYLYKINLFHEFTEHFTSGITAWRYHGLGPNFRYFMTKIGSTIWVMPAYDIETKEPRIMVGMTLNM